MTKPRTEESRRREAETVAQIEAIIAQRQALYRWRHAREAWLRDCHWIDCSRFWDAVASATAFGVMRELEAAIEDAEETP